MPKELRILKYLLTIKDPEEQMSALNDAFIPGEETRGEEVDMLYTYVISFYTLVQMFILSCMSTRTCSEAVKLCFVSLS